MDIRGNILLGSLGMIMIRWNTLLLCQIWLYDRREVRDSLEQEDLLRH